MEFLASVWIIVRQCVPCINVIVDVPDERTAMQKVFDEVVLDIDLRPLLAGLIILPVITSATPM